MARSYRLQNWEELERREVPAGVVSVLAIGNGTNGMDLTVTGDALGNEIDVFRDSSGSVHVRALGSTLLSYDPASTFPSGSTITVNTTPFEIIFSSSQGVFTGTVSIQLGGGDDQLRVWMQSAITRLDIDMGSGNNQVSVVSTDPDINIASGSGSDIVNLVNINNGGILSVSTSGGNDVVNLSNVEFGDTTISTGGGNDTLQFTGNNRFGRLRFSSGTYLGGLKVDAGTGNDLVWFASRTKVFRLLQVLAGDGNDRLWVNAAASSSDPATLEVEGPTGTVTAAINMGSGADLVRIGVGSGTGKSANLEVNTGQKTNIVMGAGNDRLYIRDAILGLLIALMQDGDDQVLNSWAGANVTVASGSKLNGGAGVDVLPAGWSAPAGLTVLSFP